MTQYTLLWFSRKLLAYIFSKRSVGVKLNSFTYPNRVLFSILKAMIVILLGWISTFKQVKQGFTTTSRSQSIPGP